MRSTHDRPADDRLLPRFHVLAASVVDVGRRPGRRRGVTGPAGRRSTGSVAQDTVAQDTAAQGTAAPDGVSAWSPMGIRVFRVLWFASLGSSIGTWMQTVGAQWFLIDAAAAPSIVALVQSASLAPAILLAVPAGAIADLFDRRRLLIGGSVASGVVTAVLTGCSVAGLLRPWSLLAFTFLIGMLATLTGPAWQAIQPELVPREMIPAAAGLGSVTVNAARAIGPALAGLLISGLGVSTTFAVNALSFFGAAAALVWWKRPRQPGADDREFLGAAVRAGLRYVRSAGLVRRILLRCALFAVPASALWALLPVVASGRLGLGSAGYGGLLAALGAGALLGVFLLPLLRRRMPDNTILFGSSAVFALGIVGTAALPLAAVLPVFVLTGAAWIGTLTVLNAALQLTLPQWVRSRGVSVYLLVFSAALALGSYAWGALAERVGTPEALLSAAGVQVFSALSVVWWGLRPATGAIDRTFSLTWPTPTLVLAPDPSDGPVTVTLRYTVRSADEEAFASLMRQVERSRRRTGAVRWRLLRSGEDPTVVMEIFVVPSWDEYRRQQTDRLTGFDRAIQDRARALSASPLVEEHLFPADHRRAGTGALPHP